MRVIEEVKKIVEGDGVSISAVARACGISPSAVSTFLERAVQGTERQGGRKCLRRSCAGTGTRRR